MFKKSGGHYKDIGAYWFFLSTVW